MWIFLWYVDFLWYEEKSFAVQADQKKKLQKELKECQDRMKANKDKTDKLKRDLENKEWVLFQVPFFKNWIYLSLIHNL